MNKQLIEALHDHVAQYDGNIQGASVFVKLHRMLLRKATKGRLYAHKSFDYPPTKSGPYDSKHQPS